MSSSRPSSRASKHARPSTPSEARNTAKQSLRAIAQETVSILPGRVKTISRAPCASKFEKFTLNDLRRLDPNDCPSFPKAATIRVINSDTFYAAIPLIKHGSVQSTPVDEALEVSLQYLAENGLNPQPLPVFKPPVVVNFANRHEPGGGWLNGAMAQEEELFFRSSLSLSLNKDAVGYPLRTPEAVYSPHVFIFRNSYADGHGLLAHTELMHLTPEVSVLSVAAINGPEVEKVVVQSRVPGTKAFKLSSSPFKLSSSPFQKPGSVVKVEDEDEDSEMSGTGEKDSSSPLPGLPPTKKWFKHNRERNLTKDKMRLVLRKAASEGHTSIVLGALGCGVFGNPPEDVANCWLEVLKEDEFSGNWWDEVVFAVMDSGNAQDGNYNIFRNVLDGKKV
ncbi:hypothetical protein QBC37DRAFT_434341 [Rhypophila decipiens]|uniref:Microbial-type PARG catalytic domain-containing protein n=1 Tax=Rhypophila decipiens TaxID=261697 RepID=A0AAN6XW93_9PEZI|nr:hypothetical protein QBC37DRAFT_434341 [Rhypophila decipiens]